jgi:hypothetical protein
LFLLLTALFVGRGAFLCKMFSLFTCNL